jgi:hypothetical protein
MEMLLGLRKNKSVNKIQAAKTKVLSVKAHSILEKIKNKGIWRELLYIFLMTVNTKLQI